MCGDYSIKQTNSRGGPSLDAHELHDPTSDIPILHIQVAILVPIGAVCAAEDALDPLILRDIKVHPLGRVRVMAEYGNDRVALIENNHSPMQIRDGDVVTLDGGRSRHPQPRDNFRDEVPIEVVMQQPT